jgi:geranylgeranyl diphosphate synthase type I
MTSRSGTFDAGLREFRDRIDQILIEFLDSRRADAASVHPVATAPYDEIGRLIAAGGKRLRPLFCLLGYQAAGGADEGKIARAGAALELLHTMALIHDDLMDGSLERRGEPASAPHLTALARSAGISRPHDYGRAVALLAGDLAAVLADELLLESGFEPKRLASALAEYHRMRVDTATGQYLDVLRAADADPEMATTVARLKGGRYTVDGPLRIGAVLAGASAAAMRALSGFGGPLGEAFQLLDDLADGDADPGAAAGVDPLVEQAKAALDPRSLEPEACRHLADLADRIRSSAGVAG